MCVKTSMVTYYARRAAEYERIYDKPERQEDLRLLRERLAQLLADTHILEVACGTGYWTKVVAQRAASVAATDINEDVLAIAQSKSIDPGRVTFQVADAFRLPQFRQSFTAGLAMFWWSHVAQSELRRFLHQFHRVLVPGAQVVFVDNRYVEGSSTPISRTDEAGNTFQNRKLAGGSTHEVLKNFPSIPELQATAAGIAEDVHIETLKHYWLMSYRVPSRGCTGNDDAVSGFGKSFPGCGIQVAKG